MAMGVGSSSGAAATGVRLAKPADVASTSRGQGAIRAGEAFHRSDSVPRLEDLIAGDSRLEELFRRDAERARGREEGDETEDDEEEEEEEEEGHGVCERGHALQFLAAAPYAAGAFVCNRCSERGAGEVYHCAACLFDLCPRCATSASALSSEPPAASSPVLETPSSWGHPLLGCTHTSHTLALLESTPYENGAYLCNLCLKTGDAAVFHCTSCAEFDLHPECARIAREITSFTHPHRLLLQPPYSRGYNAMCDGCLDVLGGSQWVYRCGNAGCDFDIHARCAKYARTISHPIHEEHELVLIHQFAATGPESSLVCDGCHAQVDPRELVYHCEECGFDIHPNCVIGEVVRS